LKMPRTEKKLSLRYCEGLKKKNVKSTGDLMAYLTMEDDEGSIEVIIFSDLYKSCGHLLKKEGLFLVKGDVDRDEKGVRVRARESRGSRTR